MWNWAYSSKPADPVTQTLKTASRKSDNLLPPSLCRPQYALQCLITIDNDLQCGMMASKWTDWRELFLLLLLLALRSVFRVVKEGRAPPRIIFSKSWHSARDFGLHRSFHIWLGPVLVGWCDAIPPEELKCLVWDIWQEAKAHLPKSYFVRERR